MTIKLLLLKSGEDIIADVQEMVSGDDDQKRVFGYILTKPCIVKMYKPNVLTEETDVKQKASFQVSLYPWLPLSKDEKIPLVADWVVTIVNPTDKLQQMYVEDVINYDGQNTGVSQQRNISISD